MKKHSQRKQNYKRLIVVLVVLIIGLVSLYVFIKYNKNDRSEVINTNVVQDYESRHVTLKKIDLSGDSYNSQILLPTVKTNSLPKDIVEKINETLSFQNVIDQSLEQTVTNFEQNQRGIVGSTYTITYDDNNILSLVVTVKHIGAYPDTVKKYYNFDLETGEIINIQKLISESAMDNFSKLCNQKLNTEIQSVLVQVDDENVVEEIKKYSVCTDADMQNFSILSNGIVVSHDFDFSHQVGLSDINILLTFDEIDNMLSDWSYTRLVH